MINCKNEITEKRQWVEPLRDWDIWKMLYSALQRIFPDCSPSSYCLTSKFCEIVQLTYWRHVVKSIEFSLSSSCKIWPLECVKEQEKNYSGRAYILWVETAMLIEFYKETIIEMWRAFEQIYGHIMPSFLHPIVLIWLITWLQEPDPQLL